jgi:hyperosmotically inducible protein
MNIKTLPRVLAIGLGSALALGAVNVAFAQNGTTPNNETDTDSEQPVTDTWITTKVKTELATTDGVSSMDIDVETLNGVVTLTGTLDSQMSIDKAVAAAQSVKGVKSVDSSGLTTNQ